MYALRGGGLCVMDSLRFGMLIGLVIGCLLGVVVRDVNVPIVSMMGGAVAGALVGAFGGLLAFGAAGIKQGFREEMQGVRRAEIETYQETCVDAALAAAAFWAWGSAITGAIIGAFFSLRNWNPGRGFTLLQAISGTALLGALLLGMAGYIAGLFWGALAPDTVLKVQARWRQWRRGMPR